MGGEDNPGVPQVPGASGKKRKWCNQKREKVAADRWAGEERK